MSRSLADDFLAEWTIRRDDKQALSVAEAQAVAATWTADAVENGIDADALIMAAGGSVADYLLRTFGEDPDAH